MTPQAPALVIGSGRSLYEDLRAVGGPQSFTVFAINNLVELADFAVDHGVSHHPEKLVRWKANRSRRRAEHPITLHASGPGPGIDRVWKEYRLGGSSGLLAVRIALALGHPSVVIAGVPLDGGGYIWSDPEQPRHQDFARYRSGWQPVLGELRGRVTAVSGYLRDLLGPPAAAAA